MDGHYSLGAHHLGLDCRPVSVYSPPMPSYDPNIENPPETKLFVFASCPSIVTSANQPNAFCQLTNATAASLQLPLLRLPWTRSLAKTSTTVRALLIYASAVVREIRDSWMGTDNREGARGLGVKWLAHLEQMQAAHGDCEFARYTNKSPLVAFPLFDIIASAR